MTEYYLSCYFVINKHDNIISDNQTHHHGMTPFITMYLGRLLTLIPVILKLLQL